MFLLCVAYVGLRFRMGSQQFTLVAVGAALTAPHVCERFSEVKQEREVVREQIADAELDRTPVQLDNENGRAVLHLSESSQRSVGLNDRLPSSDPPASSLVSHPLTEVRVESGLA
jgi:hypothetical protein